MLNGLFLTNSNCILQTYSHRFSSMIVPAHLQAIKKLFLQLAVQIKHKQKHLKLPLKLSGQEKLSR